VAKSYVDKCVTQRGCPTSSLEEARKWREENARRRPPTDQKSIDREIADQRDHDSQGTTILIPLTTAKNMAYRGYDAILDLVDQLPKSVAAQCNPADPQLALTVLQSECTCILCKACDVYALVESRAAYHHGDRCRMMARVCYSLSDSQAAQ